MDAPASRRVARAAEPARRAPAEPAAGSSKLQPVASLVGNHAFARRVQRQQAMVQRAFKQPAVDPGANVYAYEVEEEKQPPRGLAKAKQAPAGFYQHVGHDRFFKVAPVRGAWVSDPGDEQAYFHHGGSGTLREYNARSALDRTPTEWVLPKARAGGGPTGRADQDVFPVYYTIRRDADDLAQAQAIVEDLGLKPRPPEPRPGHVFHPIRTLDHALLDIVMEAPAGAAEDWAPRDRQAIDQSRERLESKLVEPHPHRTPRTTRPTDMHLGGKSATKGWTGLENKARAGKVAYEWSHLIGDGDGGSNRPDNLVAATEAANTEQLILETVQRKFQKPCAEAKLRIKIQASATLLPVPPGLAEEVRLAYHVADELRYRIYVTGRAADGIDKEVLAIDHSFDAHRQFISKSITRVMLREATAKLQRVLSTQFGLHAQIAGGSKAKPKPVVNPELPGPRALGPGRTYEDLEAFLKDVADDDARLTARAIEALNAGFPQRLLLRFAREWAATDPIDEAIGTPA